MIEYERYNDPRSCRAAAGLLQQKVGSALVPIPS